MAADMFLVLEGVEGESKDETYKKKIDIFHWSWAASNTGAGHFGGGSGAGKGQVADITVSKLIDKSSPTLLKFCMQGKHISTGKIVSRKAAGDKALEYVVLEMNEVFITNIGIGDSTGGGSPSETVNLNFSKIKMTYTLQADTGADEAHPDVTIDTKLNKTD
jgi:type VI secretion system secreted protein Hcp